MRAVRSVLVLIAFSLLTSAATAYSECAWGLLTTVVGLLVAGSATATNSRLP